MVSGALLARLCHGNHLTGRTKYKCMGNSQIRASAVAWSRYLETLQSPKYKQVSSQCGLICGSNEVGADVDGCNFSRH